MNQEEIILSQSEYESLLEEVHRLQARISELTALRDDLIYHICPALQAEYEEKIASLERELLAAEMYLRENQRTLEILQAQMNQQKKPDVDEAQKQAKEEFYEYEEDLKKKAKEAEEFKEKWEKESQWSEHDRQEKKEKKKREEKKQREKSDSTGLGKDQKTDKKTDHTDEDEKEKKQKGEETAICRDEEPTMSNWAKDYLKYKNETGGGDSPKRTGGGSGPGCGGILLIIL